MKRFIGIFMVFSALFFTGCDALGSSDSDDDTSLTAEDIENGAMATLLAGYTSMETLGSFLDNGEAATETEISGLEITVGDSNTFAYTDSEIDFEGDGTVDLILNGSFSVSTDDIITFTDYNIANGQNTSENMTINGSMSQDADNILTNEISVSGPLFSSTLTIVCVMDMSDFDNPVINSSTINGTDYLTEFNEALASMGE